MSLKLLIYILERASLEYAATGNLYALERALHIIDEIHDALNDVEELLIDAPIQKKQEA